MLIVSFRILKIVSAKIIVLWDTTTCSSVDIYYRYEGSCCLHLYASPVILLLGLAICFLLCILTSFPLRFCSFVLKKAVGDMREEVVVCLKALRAYVTL